MEKDTNAQICRATATEGTSRQIDWVSQETDEQGQPLYERTPEPKIQKYELKKGFFAAGKQYQNVHSLISMPLDKKNNLYRDKYGRNVFVVHERFPCFDSEDYKYENRYYHWYYLVDDGRLTCVYYADQADRVEVTEDVQEVRKLAWKAMEEAGVLQDDILQLSNIKAFKGIVGFLKRLFL